MMLDINRIYQGNCIELMEELPDNFMDLTVTSPPYDNLRSYSGEMQWNEDVWRSVINGLYRITKKGGVVVWVVGDATIKGSETGTSFKQALYAKECGFNLHDTMIYQKVNYVPLTHKRYEQCFEYMFILSKGKPSTFNPMMIPCKNAGKQEKYGSDRRQSHGKNHSMRLYDETVFIKTNDTKISNNIFAYTIGREKTGHPAPFPEQLASDHIMSWSNPGDTVFDPFAGSGTTLKMARQLGRNYLGFEISDEYCAIIGNRVRNLYKHSSQ